jgi:hypothetical protein
MEEESGKWEREREHDLYIHKRTTTAQSSTECLFGIQETDKTVVLLTNNNDMKNINFFVQHTFFHISHKN